MISKHKREAVLKKSDGVCWYCGVPLDGVFHCDHFIPRNQGGGDELSNLVPACADCNQRKKHYSLEVFRRRLALDVEYTEDQISYLEYIGLTDARKAIIGNETRKLANYKFYFETKGLKR